MGYNISTMKFFDRDFLKYSFQFMVMIFLGIATITFISGLNLKGEVTAGVVGGQ